MKQNIKTHYLDKTITVTLRGTVVFMNYSVPLSGKSIRFLSIKDAENYFKSITTKRKRRNKDEN